MVSRYPQGVAPFEVYCDLTSGGGGWTLIGKIGTGQYPLACFAVPC